MTAARLTYKARQGFSLLQRAKYERGPDVKSGPLALRAQMGRWGQATMGTRAASSVLSRNYTGNIQCERQV